MGQRYSDNQCATVSIVTHSALRSELVPLLDLLREEAGVCRWVVVDNGNSEEIREIVEARSGSYVRPGSNLGFGRGHNLALETLAEVNAPYHLILNPDVVFPAGTVRALASVMDARKDVGLLMPKVLYPDGGIQHLCKLVPAPFELCIRRLAPEPIQRLARRRRTSFELRSFDYRIPIHVPWLSGCFMFARRKALEDVGGFDERYFLYMEDLDLCRKLGGRWKLLFWPHIAITHVHHKASYKHLRPLLFHVASAIRYYNKWGWLLDAGRKEGNDAALADLRSNGYPV